jgi:hypothetical protein
MFCAEENEATVFPLLAAHESERERVTPFVAMGEEEEDETNMK